MQTVWFCLVAIMIAMYVVLDGFDLGAGVDSSAGGQERRTSGGRCMRSIGPVWDGNEVWLLAAGGTLFFAFPALYASGFSGFYLPLMIVLWLLILRGDLYRVPRARRKLPSGEPFGMWSSAGASLLLTVFFGAALGNVVRGVPLERPRVLLCGACGPTSRLGPDTGHSGLVHDYRWGHGSRHAHTARRPVAGAEDRRPCARSRAPAWRESRGGAFCFRRLWSPSSLSESSPKFPQICLPAPGATSFLCWR